MRVGIAVSRSVAPFATPDVAGEGTDDRFDATLLFDGTTAQVGRAHRGLLDISQRCFFENRASSASHKRPIPPAAPAFFFAVVRCTRCVGRAPGEKP